MTFIKLTKGQSYVDYEIDALSTVKDLLEKVSDNDSHQLIILEDPTPELIAELGSEWNIDPQFWADFVVGSLWFDSGKVSIPYRKNGFHFQDNSLLDQLWLLPTDARRQDHRCIQFVGHRALDREDKVQKARYRPLETTHGITNGAELGPPNSANTVPENCKLAL